MLSLGISAVMFVAMWFGGRQALGLVGVAGVSLLAGFTLIALLDVSNIQREIAVYDDQIICNSAVSNWYFQVFKFKDIHRVQLMRSGEWGHPGNVMLIHLANTTFLCGVPGRISLDSIANILHRFGVEVILNGWRPSDSDTRIQVKDELIIPENRVHGEASLQEVGTGEPKLNSPVSMTGEVILAIGPLIIWLIATIATGVYVYQNWNQLSGLHLGLIAAAEFGVFYAGLYFLINIGQFLSARYAVGFARKQMKTRSNTILSELNDELCPVSILSRDTWTTVVARPLDFGFLQIDRSSRKLRFEGNRKRWEVPLSAVSGCRIEESHVGTEGNQKAEKRYLVVINSVVDGEPWEAGMIYARTEVGRDTPESRHAHARTLYLQLAEAIRS